VAHVCGGPTNLLSLLELDGQLALADLDEAFFEQLEMLQPFGQQNPAPAFQFCRLEARRIQSAGANNSRGMFSDPQFNRINFISFGRKPEDWPPGPWDVAGIPEMNVYNGTATPQIQVLDVRPAS